MLKSTTEDHSLFRPVQTFAARICRDGSADIRASVAQKISIAGCQSARVYILFVDCMWLEHMALVASRIVWTGGREHPSTCGHGRDLSLNYT